MVQGQSGKRHNVHTQQTLKPPYAGYGFRSGKAVADIAWVAVLCVGRANHLVHESTWPEFSQLASGTHFCILLLSAYVASLPHIPASKGILPPPLLELNSLRDLPWNSNFQASLVSLTLMKNLIHDQHMVQSLSLSSISHFLQLQKSCAATGFKERTIAKTLLSLLEHKHRLCLPLSSSKSDSLLSSLSRHNIWNFLS